DRHQHIQWYRQTDDLMTPAVVHSQKILRLGTMSLGQYRVVSTRNPKWLTAPRESVDSRADGRSLRLIWCAIAGLFRSRTALQAEILILRHQVNVLPRRSPKRAALSRVDRLVFVGLYRLAPKVLDALTILQPETVIRWHRAGFQAYRRRKSR